jgi:hypothetical protein
VPALLDQIDALLNDDSSHPVLTAVVQIERTLTDGYARVLALEGERLRIEREIEGVTAAIGADDASRRAEELSLLARRRSRIDGDVERLRNRLALLRRRGQELRALMPQPQVT